MEVEQIVAEIKADMAKLNGIPQEFITINPYYISDLIAKSGEYNGEFIDKRLKFNHHARITRNGKYYDTLPVSLRNRVRRYMCYFNTAVLNDNEYSTYREIHRPVIGNSRMYYRYEFAESGHVDLHDDKYPFLFDDDQVLPLGFKWTIERRCLVQIGQRLTRKNRRGQTVIIVTTFYSMIRIKEDGTWCVDRVATVGKGGLTTEPMQWEPELLSRPVGNVLL